MRALRMVHQFSLGFSALLAVVDLALIVGGSGSSGWLVFFVGMTIWHYWLWRFSLRWVA